MQTFGPSASAIAAGPSAAIPPAYTPARLSLSQNASRSTRRAHAPTHPVGARDSAPKHNLPAVAPEATPPHKHRPRALPMPDQPRYRRSDVPAQGRFVISCASSKVADLCQAIAGLQSGFERACFFTSATTACVGTYLRGGYKDRQRIGIVLGLRNQIRRNPRHCRPRWLRQSPSAPRAYRSRNRTPPVVVRRPHIGIARTGSSMPM